MALPAGLRHDGSGVVAANIVEGAQNAVVAADDDDGFAGDRSAHELARASSPDRCARPVARSC